MTVAVAASGSIGSGFLASSLDTAVSAGADFIGCDGGSTDGGPYFLGAGVPKVSAEAYKRDLRLMLRAAVERSIPLIMGSSGYSGARAHLDWAARLVRDVAVEEGMHFPMATIDSEQRPDQIEQALADGRITPLGTSQPLSVSAVHRTARIVAQMGSEPMEAALSAGAQVVVAGRATDMAIFTAFGRTRNEDGGPAWHAAKVIECGAACAANRRHADSMVARIAEDHFVVTPPNPDMYCTPQTVAAHALYENADPFHIIEPSGVLDISQATYVQEPDGRSVRVSGSRVLPRPHYDVKLEAARLAGYRSVALGGIRDQVVLGQLDSFMPAALATVRRKVHESIGLTEDQYTLTPRLYGGAGAHPAQADGFLYGGEAAIVLDVVAPTQDAARGVCALAWHTMLHHPVPEWLGSVSNLAFPFSPPHSDLGAVYEFAMDHVMRLDDALSVAHIDYEDV